MNERAASNGERAGVGGPAGFSAGFGAKLRPALAAAVLAGWGVMIATPAYAFQEFPSKVQSTFGSPCPPPCNLCHVSPTGGGAHRDLEGFSRPMQAVLDNPAAARDKFQNLDHDEDGVSDLNELVQGTDPQGTLPMCSELKYGACAFTPGPPSASRTAGTPGSPTPTPVAPWLAALGALAFLSRRVVFGSRRP